MQANAKIFLLVLALPFSQDLDTVVFDMNWKHNKLLRTYLDASVDIFGKSDKEHFGSINYKNKTAKSEIGKIEHSGDDIDDDKNEGHHRITVGLKTISHQVRQVFFTLSSWSSRKFPVSLKLDIYEDTRQSYKLYTGNIQQNCEHRAIVICSLVRSNEDENQWLVYDCNMPSHGNLKDYGPILKTIKGSFVANTTSDKSSHELEVKKISGPSRPEFTWHRLTNYLFKPDEQLKQTNN